jgi:hypothetical protein
MSGSFLVVCAGPYVPRLIKCLSADRWKTLGQTRKKIGLGKIEGKRYKGRHRTTKGIEIVTIVDEDIDRFRAYIDSVGWKFAKSYSTHPHWYTVRWDRPDLDDTFIEFTNYIRTNGYIEYFYRKPFTFFVIDEFKYWTMGEPIYGPDEVPKRVNTYIMNRAKINAIYGQQR